MKWDSVQFTNAINEVRINKVRPAVARAVFQINNEEDSAASISYATGKAKGLSGSLSPVGAGDSWDRLIYAEGLGSQKVLVRRIAIKMNDFERRAAEDGRVSDFLQRAQKVFELHELEIDSLAFQGDDANGVPGVLSATHYGSGKGTAINSAKKLDAMTVQEATKVIDEAVITSSNDGKFRGPKVLVGKSSIFLKLRHLTYTSGMSAMQKIIEIDSNLKFFDTPDVGDDLLILDSEEATLRFPFYMRQVGDIKEEGGDMTAFFAGSCAGVIVRDPGHLVKVTGLL